VGGSQVSPVEYKSQIVSHLGNPNSNNRYILKAAGFLYRQKPLKIENSLTTFNPRQKEKKK
jgi:hypothetical protein